MLSFDFITDDEFRKSLESDWRELEAAFAGGSWKSVHVLAGSIVEAVLIDYLEGTSIPNTTTPDLLKMTLDDLVTLCTREKIITERASQLSTVVRGYRNLIHPGRVRRLKEKVDEHSANVAKSLVAMIVKEVETRKRENYGYTAQQIVKKIEADATVIPILPHLIMGLKKPELQRLILTVLPDHYWKLWQHALEASDLAVLERLGKCYRIAFDSADTDLKKMACGRVVSTIKEGDAPFVEIYETVFFRGSDLAYLEPPEQSIVKAHLLGQLRADPKCELVSACEGVGPFLDAGELRTFLDAMIATIIYNTPADAVTLAIRRVKNEFVIMSEENQERTRNRLHNWVGMCESKQLSKGLERLPPLREDFLEEHFKVDDIPF